MSKDNQLHNHQAHPLRVSLPTKRDSLTRRKTSRPTIKERPTGEASNLCHSSLLSTSSGAPQQDETTGHHSSPPKGRLTTAAQQAPVKANQRQEQRAYWGHLQGLQPSRVVTLQSLSAFPPYSRKPGPYGPTMSVCAKVMSRGVHNIAFSLSPDDSCAFDLEK